MSAATPLSLANLTAPPAPGQCDPGGGSLFSYLGQPYWLDSGGNLWALTTAGARTAAWSQGSAPGVRQAADMGYISWTYDPVVMSNTSTALNGVIFLFGIKLYSPQTITNLSVFNAIVAVTPTANQNWLALVDSTGAVQGKTTAGQIDTQTTTVGVLTAAMQTPYAAPAGRYWVAALFNAATPLQLGRGVGFNTAPNLGVTAANYWYATNGTSATVIPASFTPGSNSLSNMMSGWAAVS